MTSIKKVKKKSGGGLEISFHLLISGVFVITRLDVRKHCGGRREGKELIDLKKSKTRIPVQEMHNCSLNIIRSVSEIC